MRPLPVCKREVTGIQFRAPAGRTGLIRLETPSAASAQEIPQMPGDGIRPAGGAVIIAAIILNNTIGSLSIADFLIIITASLPLRKQQYTQLSPGLSHLFLPSPHFSPLRPQNLSRFCPGFAPLKRSSPSRRRQVLADRGSRRVYSATFSGLDPFDLFTSDCRDGSDHWGRC